ncbi:MAG: membrane protein insertase YidC [Proteobacteria bacterium]|nr:membrane protein insertase YidC [Pseudomonadota bacterium]
MDRNYLLAFALSFVVLTGWMMLEAQLRPPPEVVEPAAPAGEEPTPGPGGGRPASPSPAPTAQTPPPPTPVVQAETEMVIEGELFRAVLSDRGAALKEWELKTYSERIGEGRERRMELTTGRDVDLYALVTPLEELGGGSLADRIWTVTASGDEAVQFETNVGGVRVTKTYGFDPESYLFRLTLAVENGGDRIVSPRFGVHWPASHRDSFDFREQSLVALWDGDLEQEAVAGFGTPGFFGGFFGGPPTMEEKWTGRVAWGGVGTRYFVSAILPERAVDAEAVFLAVEPGKISRTVVRSDAVELPPGQRLERQFRVYAGPKERARLEAVGAGLPVSINIGWAWVAPLAEGFEWLLHACYAVVPNYGVAIVILTLLVRIVTAPIMAKQMKSSEKMRELQPRMKEIQEKFADDRQKQSEEMMKMYREVGFNPLGGCLPMILQMPVFIGLFYALQSAIELRHAPFFWWIDDLSAPETLFTLPGFDLPVRALPLLMGLSMFLQQKMTPMPGDPAQARMMLTVMPLMMIFFFYTFPSGLVLYWMLSNVLGILHQLWLRRQQAKA